MIPSSSTIQVRNLRKVYYVPEREAGVWAAVKSLVRRRSRQVVAVNDITFSLEPGEVVGFVGPNGAGKTTTLKMLSGLLYPTAGEVKVLGYEPSRRDKDFLRQITLVMGQRNQLVWDIPAIDSFELNRAIYQVPWPEYRRTLDELVELLEVGPLLQKPVRNLSLGERMKCEIIAALLHRPRVLFLDEPTLGLDISMQRRIRAFIHTYSGRYETIVLLTSHYMADVVELCRRAIMIHKGKLLFDGELSTLVHRFSPHKTIHVKLAEQADNLYRYGEVVTRKEGNYTLLVPKDETATTTSRLLADLPVTDLTVEDPPIEDIIEHIFNGGVT